MIKEVNHVCEELNEKLGICIRLPTPDKKTLHTAAICNLVLGLGLAASGVILSSKGCVVLGGIGLVSSVILRRESRRKSLNL